MVLKDGRRIPNISGSTYMLILFDQQLIKFGTITHVVHRRDSRGQGQPRYQVAGPSVTKILGPVPSATQSNQILRGDQTSLTR